MLCFPCAVWRPRVGLSRDHRAVSGSIPGVHDARFQPRGAGEQRTQSPVELSMTSETHARVSLWWMRRESNPRSSG